LRIEIKVKKGISGEEKPKKKNEKQKQTKNHPKN